MKKVLFVLLALGLVACTAEEKKEKIPKVMCSSDCSGALAGNPDYRCDLYDSGEYQGGSVTCEYNQTSSTCEVITTACDEIPAALMFQACEGYGQGNCDDGLECASVNQTKSVCMTPCQDEFGCTDVEGEQGACIQTAQNQGHCFRKTSVVNDICGWDNFSVCADGAGSCTVSKINYVNQRAEYSEFRCKDICDPTTGENSCGSGSCLPAPNGVVQGIESVANSGSLSSGNDFSDFKPCDTTDECSVGFECASLRFTNGSSGNYCTLFEHWCGESAQFCDQFDRTGMTRCAQQNPCNIEPEYDMCAVVGATDTPADTSCWGNFQVDGNDLYPICLASCENENIKNAAGDDLKILDCGTGYSCETPAAGKELSYIHQSDVDSQYSASATCNDDYDCDSSRGFSCIAPRQGDSKSCNRSVKVCILDAQ